MKQVSKNERRTKSIALSHMTTPQRTAPYTDVTGRLLSPPSSGSAHTFPRAEPVVRDRLLTISPSAAVKTNREIGVLSRRAPTHAHTYSGPSPEQPRWKFAGCLL